MKTNIAGGTTDASTSPSAELAELPVRERIQALDVLRGIAVGGILLANVMVFFGLFALPAGGVPTLASNAADSVARLLERVFVDGKFYSIFSLLFGIGFGVQLSRGGDAALPRFRRRLKILLAIGALHAFLIWAGDILMLYALLGLTMPWFAQKSDRALLKWTAGLLIAPTALYIVGMALWMLAGPHAAQSSSGAMPAVALRYLEAMGRGGLKDAVVGNLVFVGLRWADLIATMRFPKVLGMFVLGLWTVRAGIALDPARHRPTLIRWTLLGWGIGLPANLIAVWSIEHWPYLMPSFGGLLGVVMQAIGIPFLAIGYAASVALFVVDGQRVVNPFAPVGRMALTNYLMHSIICVVLSYGFGFGLWWRLGASKALGVAVAIIAVQIPLSAWWLSRHRFGPVEWVWRRLTYRQPI
jgi:uncharacterized protein